MLLKDKVAIVTGSGRGIGREIALRLAREGANIVLCDVNLQDADKTKDEVKGLAVEALSVQVDVTQATGVEEMVKKSIDKFSRIDILVNNAGITRDGLLVRMKEEDWDAVMDVNLKGAFLCTKAAARYMMRQESGAIVNIASVIGLAGNAGQANYAASKGGLIAFTKTVARELASRNIRCNAVAPGYIQTDMTAKLAPEVREAILKTIPLAKLGTAKDVADVVLFLASDAARYITGTVIQVDGGMFM